MHRAISFRPLERSDFPLLQQWLSEPHVAEWWNERTDLPSIQAKYGPRIDGSEPTRVFVMELEGSPFGWIQWYRWADYPDHARQLGVDHDSAGIDLAIGDASLTGLGLGPLAIRDFLQKFIFTNANITAVVTDPEVANLRSLRAFEKAGFHAVKTIQLPGETRMRQIMRFSAGT